MSLDLIPYSSFTSKYKKNKLKYADADTSVLDYFTAKVSPKFAEMIKEEGLCIYADGLFTIVNPIVYESVLRDFGIFSEKSVVLLKSAFGDIFYYNGVQVKVLHTCYNENYAISGGDAVKSFFILHLKDASFCSKRFKKKLFAAALKQHGSLAFDETYGFVPAIHLGGEEKLENVQKVKTLEYLKILSQTFG